MANVLVTGASKGIGLATVVAFARAGHRVAAGMRNPGQAPELGEITARENLHVSIETMDVDDDISVNRAIERIVQDIGPIDVLVNNAGIVTSISGRIAASPMGPYAASKFALEALSECLAQEVKPFNVRVAVVEPGIIDTSMAARISNDSDGSRYPNRNRMAALFRSSLQHPTSPTLVADKIIEIATGDATQLRHPVAPDAAPFIAWREAMSDEEWVAWGALDDDAWYAAVQADFGLDARPKS